MSLQKLQNLDPEEALAVIEALEQKKRKEEFIKFWQPHPEQKQVFDNFTEEIKELYVLGGNRAGKTDPGAAICIAYLLGKKYFKDEPAWDWVKNLPIPEDRPRVIWATGLSFDVLRDVIWSEKFINGKNHPAFLPKNFEEHLRGKIRLSDFQLIAEDGSTLTCKSAEAGADKFQSASVDLVWIDEECDSSIADECFQRTADCAGKILVTLTPLTDMSTGVRKPWVFSQVQKGRRGHPDIKVVQLSVLNNPYIPEKEKQRLVEKWKGHVEENARLYGEFIQRSGLVFKMFEQKTHLIPRKNLPQDWYRLNVIDPAPSGPTGCIWTCFDNDGNMYVDGGYKQSGLVVSDHAKDILVDNASKMIDLWLIDPKGGNQKNAETHRTCADLYKQHGIPVRFPKFDEEFGREALAEYLKATHEPTSRHPKIFIFNDQHELIDEMTSYIWDSFSKGVMKGLSKEKPVKGHDDLLQCLCMAAGQMKGRKPPRKHQQDYASPQERQTASRHLSYT
jgi:phage terminase large subunit-like protein